MKLTFTEAIECGFVVMSYSPPDLSLLPTHRQVVLLLSGTTQSGLQTLWAV